LRWLICGVLFFGSVINYIDRGTISILSHHVQQIFSMSQSDYGWIIFSFQFSYAIMMLVFGRIIDRLGTRTGFALAMAWWSLAAMGQAFARGVASFAVACGLLGMGEAGNFPGSIKAVAEWFPKRERALATGIFNSGTAVGAVISYPLVGWLFIR
jgi:ACS family hexuronate transporter-like MFS transporter